jgi:polysaccharide biosynthesis/export protein
MMERAGRSSVRAGDAFRIVMPVRRTQQLALVLGSLVLAACSSGAGGPYVWASQFAPTAEPVTGYRIQAGDLLHLQVWSNEPLSVKARVRSDGKFAVPLVGELAVVGESPDDVAKRVERQLTADKIVLSPRVTLIVEEATPLTIAVLGKVTRSGSYPLTGEKGVADALAAAGGLTEFAHKDRIYVLRRQPTPVRIRFQFNQLFEQGNLAARFTLRPGDVVLVD